MSAETITAKRLFIGGEWADAEGGRTFEDRDPFNGDLVAEVAAGSRADAHRAVEAAAAPFAAWAATPPAVRQGVFLKAADVLESRHDEVVSLLARETGSTFGFAMFQMHFVPGLFRQAAGARVLADRRGDPVRHRRLRDGPAAPGRRRRCDRAVECGADPVRALDRRAARARQHRRAQAVRVVAVVGGLIWGEIFAEAGLPAGVLNIVTHAPGEAAPIGDELVENPHVRRLNFTGSTGTGRKLAEAAGRQLKRIVLELGGYNPLIVLGDADLDYAVNATAFGAFLHQGQICMSARRIIVERSISDEFIVTPRREDQRPQGRRSEGARHDHRAAHQRRGAADGQAPGRRRRERGREGARGRRGGRPVLPARRCSPTFRRTRTSPSTETFGPVAAIEIVDSAEEAVARANATSYGLSSGIITQDTDRGLALAGQIDAGIVHVNDQPVGDEPQMPFGGVKDSGFGRFGGSAVVDEFTELRWVTVQRGIASLPVLR